MALLCLAGCTAPVTKTEEIPAEPEKKYMTVARETEMVGDIPVQHMILPHDSPRRTGEIREIRYVTIHETDNRGSTADAFAHGSMLVNSPNDVTAWHYTVDDHAIVQHLPDNEVAFNAGDGRTRDGGNINGIGIEMCVGLGNDYEQTLKNTAALTAVLLKTYGLTEADVRTHSDFMDKVCPHRLLTEGRWEEFVQMVEDCLKQEDS